MELYMMNRQHGRMILESVENGPLIWPTIEENGVTRPKKYSELSATEAIQADCDVKATNIILQGLPHEVYALVSNHQIVKELWERIHLLMQGTSLTKQEREHTLSSRPTKVEVPKELPKVSMVNTSLKKLKNHLAEVKAQSQEKDTVIKKLKEKIKSLSGKMNEDKIKKDLEEIETINIELDHMVSKLVSILQKEMSTFRT
ncbi:hypothetical protein Tco_0226672 [Tanacetum coccineum]